MCELSSSNIVNTEILDRIKADGKLSNISAIPEKIKLSFKTALEISPKAHLKIQSELQKVVDDAISKTINLPKETTVEDIENIYKEAYICGLKGITIFRLDSVIKQPKKVAK